MNYKKVIAPLATLAIAGAMVAAPATASAQWRDSYAQHRQDMKNQWQNLAIGSAAVGVLGLLTHNDTLTVAGLGGAAYSGYRYSQESGKNCYTGYNNGYYDNSYNSGTYYNPGYYNGGYSTGDWRDGNRPNLFFGGPGNYYPSYKQVRRYRG